MEGPVAHTTLARLLAGGSPREVLARIAKADSLGLRARIARRMRERVLLLDAERVHLRALALTANGAPGRAWEGRIDAWLTERIDEALDALQREGARGCAPPAAPHAISPVPAVARGRGEDGLEVFAARLGLEPTALRRGLDAFHRLPRGHRAALVDVVLREPAGEPSRRGEEDATGELRLRRARQAFAAILEEGAAPSTPKTRPIRRS